MNSNGYVAYKTTKVETADQGKLILIAYDVAIKHCKMSLDKFGKYECIEERSKHLCRAQDAVNELMGALRMDVGEIAGNLYRLYSYIIRRLVEANIKNDRKPVDEVLNYLTDLRDAWRQAIVNVKKEQFAEAGEPALQTLSITG